MPQTQPNFYKEPAVFVATTVANLRTQRGPADSGANALAILLGSSAAFDQALKLYAWDPSSSTSDNGTTVIKPTAVSGNGRWRSP